MGSHARPACSRAPVWLKFAKGKNMSKAAVRGTKRWCQDEACGLPFYDLNRDDFACPNCGASYKAVAPVAVVQPDQRFPRRPGRPPAQVPQAAELEPKTEIAEDAETEVELEKDDALESLLEPDDDEAVDLPLHPSGEDVVKE